MYFITKDRILKDPDFRIEDYNGKYEITISKDGKNYGFMIFDEKKEAEGYLKRIGFEILNMDRVVFLDHIKFYE